jgi:hypothetical protein
VENPDYRGQRLVRLTARGIFDRQNGQKGGAKVSNELQKTKNALVPNCMKAFAGTFGSPAIMALGAFDPWLCVTAFRQLCPFVFKIIKQYNRTF